MFRNYAIAVALASLIVISTSNAYGHGLGFDESIPVSISGKQVSVEVTIKPASVETATQEQPIFTVRAHEPNSNETIPDMDFRVLVESRNEVILDQRFHAPDGLISAKLVPDKDASIALVNGQPASSNQVQVSQSQPVEIRSRLMSDGGLYHVAVTLEKSSAGLDLNEDRTFDLYVSISKTQDFEVETADGKQTMSVKTYYDDVQDFNYDTTKKTISFSMPFDWSPAYVGQVSVLHMEVQFPKTVSDLHVNGYRGTLNGIDLLPESIQIDDFTYEDKRLVHFVLSNTKLTSLTESIKGNQALFTLTPLEKPKFPIDLFSSTEKYLFQLSWGPEIIKTGETTTFVMNLQDPKTGDLVRNASFDFVLSRAGNEVYSEKISSNLGTFSNTYTFSQAGTYRLLAKNINGEQETAQIDLVVLQGDSTAPVQQEQKPSGCLIATAAFGSELTPQVQFLRGFRDNYILQSSSGSAFMGTFNNVYYSFSPQVADYERQQPWLQSTVKVALYPLFGILMASEKAFAVAGGGEGGTILAGATASSLIGAVYVSPVAIAVAVAARRKIGNKTLMVGTAIAIAFLAVTGLALLLNLPALLSAATPAFVVSAAATSALAVSRAIAILRTR